MDIKQFVANWKNVDKDDVTILSVRQYKNCPKCYNDKNYSPTGSGFKNGAFYIRLTDEHTGETQVIRYELKYNGWTNRDTWCISLWLDESNSIYGAFRKAKADKDLIGQKINFKELRDYVKDIS